MIISVKSCPDSMILITELQCMKKKSSLTIMRIKNEIKSKTAHITVKRNTITHLPYYMSTLLPLVYLCKHTHTHTQTYTFHYD